MILGLGLGLGLGLEALSVRLCGEGINTESTITYIYRGVHTYNL